MKDVWHTLTTKYSTTGLQYNQIIICNPLSKRKKMGTKSSLLITFRHNPRELTPLKVYNSTGATGKNNLIDKATLIK